MSTFDVALSALAVPASSAMTRKLAIEITGGLSNPSKMPGHAWGIPAVHCQIGSKLAKVQGSVCENCYALRNFYRMPAVKNAYQRRMDRMNDPRWVEAMVFLIEETGDEYFRVLDSGDLQSIEMLRQIVAVCRQLPKVRFWMPTREYKIVQDYRNQGGQIPENLTIRLSAHMKDAAPPSGYGLNTSTVHTSEENEPAGHICRAYQNANKCGDCRACWDKEITSVSYLEH